MANSTLTLVERFDGICGEGSEIGLKAHFIRLAGCNMPNKCSGWPCDSPHSWDPTYKDQWEKVDAKKLAVNMAGDYSRLFITGGEPLLQAEALVTMLKTYRTVRAGDSCEVILQTNGTIDAPQVFALCDMISADCKTPGSGGRPNDPVLTSILSESVRRRVQVKFLIATEADYQFAQDRAWKTWRYAPQAEVVLGVANLTPAGGPDPLDRLALLDLQRRWAERFLADSWPPSVRFLPQWHTLLWGNERKR